MPHHRDGKKRLSKVAWQKAGSRNLGHTFLPSEVPLFRFRRLKILLQLRFVDSSLKEWGKATPPSNERTKASLRFCFKGASNSLPERAVELVSFAATEAFFRPLNFDT